jgi:DNA-binding NtrC family response regulator
MSTTATGPRILIVDDDKMYCQVLRTYLDQVGFSTAVAHSAADVLDKVRLGCDLVLLDLYMVRETGIDALIALTKEVPDLPVVIMTGYASSELRQTAANLGARAFLKKPFAMTVLKKTIEELLPPATAPGLRPPAPCA